MKTVVVLTFLAFAALLTFVSADPEVDGQVYEDCNNCTSRGEAVDCTKICPPCIVNGKEYQWGESVPSRDCNKCTCIGGAVACTKIYCPQCIVNGTKYNSSQPVPICDPTLECTCDMGIIKCTSREPCLVNEKIYQPGHHFPSPDGCNRCSCLGPEVICTLMACFPDNKIG